MNLLDLIAPEVNLKKTSDSYKGGQWSGPCPFCGGTDRFQVWPYAEVPGWWCRVCGENGNDVIYIMKTHNMSSLEAKEFLGKAIERRIARTRPPELPVPKLEDLIRPNIDMEEFERSTNEQAKERAAEYYVPLGISKHSIYKWDIGYRENGLWSGYLIPYYIRDGEGKSHLTGASIRRDDSRAFDPRMVKYISWRGSRKPGFFGQPLTSLPAMERIGPYCESLFIVESEKDVIVLDQAGYNAVAFKGGKDWLYHIDKCLKNVMIPIIIQDNDDGPGEEIAQRLFKAIKRRDDRRACLITKTPKYKQVSDLVAAEGEEALHEFIRDNFRWIEPNAEIQNP
jgi:DNA primase